MNKNELISAMSSASNLSQTQCTEALQTFINTVTNELKGGSEVKIIGLVHLKSLKGKQQLVETHKQEQLYKCCIQSTKIFCWKKL